MPADNDAAAAQPDIGIQPGGAEPITEGLDSTPSIQLSEPTGAGAPGPLNALDSTAGSGEGGTQVPPDFDG
jgi:hypothetical protein